MAEVDHVFVYNVRGAVQMMRENGINETRIACIVTEIRSAAISEERRRLEAWVREHPPTHHPHGAVMEAIKDG